MRAEWTASGGCTSGSTAHPRGATRRAYGGAAMTSTWVSESLLNSSHCGRRRRFHKFLRIKTLHCFNAYPACFGSQQVCRQGPIFDFVPFDAINRTLPEDVMETFAR